MSMICVCDQCGKQAAALFGIERTWLQPHGWQDRAVMDRRTGRPIAPRTENYRGHTVKHYCSHNCLMAARVAIVAQTIHAELEMISI